MTNVTEITYTNIPVGKMRLIKLIDCARLCCSKTQSLCCKVKFMATLALRRQRSEVRILSRGFDAYPKRQFVTESMNINSVVDHSIWSTIKTLPATLPEPRFKDGISSAGVTGAVSASDLDVCWGGGG